MRLICYHPEIPQNVGTLMRLAACLGFPLELIEPLGFLFSSAHLRRSGLDYRDYAQVTRYPSWDAFLAQKKTGRVVALAPRAPKAYTDFSFLPTDHLMVGPESRGLPSAVQDQADTAVAIPMRPGMRSLNVALAATLVMGEALRQNNLMPRHPPLPHLSDPSITFYRGTS